MWDIITRSEVCPYVWILPANADNFAYLVIDSDSGEAAVVDGVCVEEIEKLLEQQHATLKFILTTHHHEDHSSGNASLHKRYPEAADGRNGGSLGSALKFEAIATPVHTMDHLCYYFLPKENSASPPFVFTGDFLFRCGCGYFFEGTAQDFESSVKKLYNVCDVERTLMFFGHEYCAGNFKFAESFEPENDRIRQARENTLALTPPTRRTPSSLKEELETSPFIRAVLQPNTIPEHYRQAASQDPTLPLCGYVREAKNKFKS